MVSRVYVKMTVFQQSRNFIEIIQGANVVSAGYIMG